MSSPGRSRYFFNVRDGMLITDPDGSDLPSLEAARAYALRSARELWAEAMLNDHDLSDAAFEILDEAGRRVALLPLVEALPRGLRERLKP